MPAPRLTTDEYLSTPETMLPQELVYGYVREAAAAPSPGHQWVVGAVYRALWAHMEQTGAGTVWLSPVDVVLDSERGLVLQPDIVVVATERRHIVTDRIRGAPDLVIEVLSPRPRLGRLDERLAWFAEYRVRECWLVRHRVRKVEVITVGDGTIERRVIMPKQRVQSKVLPNFDLTPSILLSDA